MNLIMDVEDLAEKFAKNTGHVFINHDRVAELVNNMINTGIEPFPKGPKENIRLVCMKELVASSINYCYWYGKSDIRPNDGGSGLMYELVNNAFEHYGHKTIHQCISALKSELALNRFPLLEERHKHLTEIADNGELYVMNLHIGYTNNQLKPEEDNYRYIMSLVTTFPGFASDLFLKRVSLFFMQLYRKLGWYEKMMDYLPVPADYQVPKMLKHFGCIKYKEPLNTIVEVGELIPKGSIMECEIRAATIIVCELLRQQTKWNMSEIDSWLWLRRKECNDPFHLTITTDY